MIEQFYEKFKEWSKQGTVWIYSDPHFGDEELRAAVHGRPEDDELLSKINKCVGKKDTFICLGDVGNISFIQKIKGYKVLICGNHDAGASNYRREIKKFIISDDLSKEKIISEYSNWTISIKDNEAVIDNHLFDEVYEGPLMVGPKIFLSHEPTDINWALNIHGHDHNFYSKNDKFHFNVCADKINYTPVNLNQLLKSGILSNIESAHRTIINKATKRKNN